VKAAQFKHAARERRLSHLCLEQLRGDREGQWSIRINDQWRICFRWEDRDAYDVEVTDYH
jgi:plasmid maintenance system killer protein